MRGGLCLCYGKLIPNKYHFNFSLDIHLILVFILYTSILFLRYIQLIRHDKHPRTNTMKATLLLALRTTLGLLLIIWGLVKVMAGAKAIQVSDKYYEGILSAEYLQPLLGWGEVVLGVFVILGLFRKVTYTLQAVVLVLGTLAIWKFILDPFGLYLVDEASRKILFFPSSTVAIASLIMLVFISDDRFSLDRLFFGEKGND